mgnify:CR=1 FL=1
MDKSHLGREIYSIIKTYDFTTESSFVEKLNEEQIAFLDEILPKEMAHAEEAGDEKRLMELNEIYELLY